jgi:O-methyltransferase
VLVFTDVDLVDSLEPCVQHLWPLLAAGCRFYTHEATHMEIASVFFDTQWWLSHINEPSPGLVGPVPDSAFFLAPLATS